MVLVLKERVQLNNINLNDLILTISGCILSISLFPEVYKSFKTNIVNINYFTLITTCIGLYAIIFVYINLGLVLAFTTNVIIAICWSLLLCLKLIYHGSFDEKTS